MPKHQGSRVCGEVGFVRWQHRADEAQVLVVTDFGAGGDIVAIDCNRECRFATEQAEKNDVVIVNAFFDLESFQKNRRFRLATNQATITPDWHEARGGIGERFFKPLAILAQLTAAVDKCARKNIMVLHQRMLTFFLVFRQ